MSLIVTTANAQSASTTAMLSCCDDVSSTSAAHHEALTRQPPQPACTWPRFQRFLLSNAQADGRVIDHGPLEQSTSEGQAYAMFFALVDDDREHFDRLLTWTQDNLAAGDLSHHLPAWHWGKHADNSYGVIDANSAADADLWIAYDLAEAGRLWHEPRYSETARAVLQMIESKEIVTLPGFGAMLAPGPVGFVLKDSTWRLNPSYLPLPLLRVAATINPSGPWQQIADNTVRLVQATSPHGFAPDWTAYLGGNGFVADPVKGDTGSYDAIRVYLWAGLTSQEDPNYGAMLNALGGMAATIDATGTVPERVRTLSGEVAGNGPAGFSAALLPYLRALDRPAAFERLSAQLSTVSDKPLNYYDSVLTLFAEGALQGRYRFDALGRLVPQWSQPCER